MLRIAYCLTISCLVVLCSFPAAAASVTVYPNTPALTDTAGSVVGNTTTSAPGFDEGSWQATGVKSNFYITPQELFGHTVRVSDVLSMSYWTNQEAYTGISNWSLYVYTAKSGAGDMASWYRSRLFAYPGAGATGWDEWTTAGLGWVDTKRGNGNDTSDLLWSSITAGEVTLNGGNKWDYSGETVQTFSVQTDSAAATFTGLVDGMTITLKNGETGRVNFEAVPEPATWGLFALGAGLVALGRRYRR